MAIKVDLFILIVTISLAIAINGSSAAADDDSDIDDDGESGYVPSNQGNVDADESNQRPSGYSSSDDSDADDDDADDTDETRVTLSSIRPFSQSYSRFKRSISNDHNSRSPTIRLQRVKRYAKKSNKYLGPVYTYVKTDKHAHFKWGVKHKVGKHLG